VKTVYFATDCIEDMHVWMHAMNQAATVQLPPGYAHQSAVIPLYQLCHVSLLLCCWLGNKNGLQFHCSLKLFSGGPRVWAEG